MQDRFTISLEKALELRDQGALLVDARSPDEFATATIPGAINVPLLDNAQRHQVGLTYKQQGKRQARRLGGELISAEIPAKISAVEQHWQRSMSPVIVFCWRGGMRSKALATFLDLAGIQARQLVGGHQAFRSHVFRFFEEGHWGRLVVLRGLTGVGKTRLLHQLAQQGRPMIDLEGLANHRGSAFGNLGLPQQPGQKMFESLLWDRLRKIPLTGYALAEGESKHIGRLVLPKRVYAALQVETSIWVEASLDQRVRVILEDYPARDQLKKQFGVPLRALKARLGGERLEEMLRLLDAGEWPELTRQLMVHYYDPLYRHTEPERRIVMQFDPQDEKLLDLNRAIDKVLAEPPKTVKEVGAR